MFNLLANYEKDVNDSHLTSKDTVLMNLCRYHAGKSNCIGMKIARSLVSMGACLGCHDRDNKTILQLCASSGCDKVFCKFIQSLKLKRALCSKLASHIENFDPEEYPPEDYVKMIFDHTILWVEDGEHPAKYPPAGEMCLVYTGITEFDEDYSIPNH